MVHRQVSADEIRRTLLGRINSGQYAVGTRIPPARILATEFGANRNTVNKAFQELAREGLVTLVPGRGGGTFVRDSNSAPVTINELRAALKPLVEHGRAQGLSKAQLSALAREVIDAAYDADLPRIKFLECNIHDAHELVKQLEPAVDCRLEPGVIDQEELTTLCDRYDLVVTTFHHLAEISRILPDRRDRVIGVHAVPTAEVALRIARLEVRRLGLICGRENTAQSMKYLVASYHPDDELEVALVDDTERVRALARSAEALIVTYSCAAAVAELIDRQPDIVVEFQIDPQSIAFLRQRITDLQGARQHAH